MQIHTWFCFDAQKAGTLGGNQAHIPLKALCRHNGFFIGFFSAHLTFSDATLACHGTALRPAANVSLTRTLVSSERESLAYCRHSITERDKRAAGHEQTEAGLVPSGW